MVATTFRESQRFSPLFFLLPPFVVALGILVNREVMLPTTVAVAVLLPGLWLLMRLQTEVTGDAVRVRLLPFWWRAIPFAEIAAAEAVTYRPLRDYGGWGIKWGLGGIAYNARGDRGVRLELKRGGHVLIGSQRAAELRAAVNV